MDLQIWSLCPVGVRSAWLLNPLDTNVVFDSIFAFGKIPYFAMYNVFPCIVCTHVFGPNFQEKKIFILIFKLIDYIYKLIIIFQGIILHIDIVIAF